MKASQCRKMRIKAASKEIIGSSMYLEVSILLCPMLFKMYTSDSLFVLLNLLPSIMKKIDYACLWKFCKFKEEVCWRTPANGYLYFSTSYLLFVILACVTARKQCPHSCPYFGALSWRHKALIVCKSCNYNCHSSFMKYQSF